MNIVNRDVPPRAVWAMEQGGIHPLLARLYAARGVQSPAELDNQLARLLPPEGLLGAQACARLLADAIDRDRHLCIVADYDCDGATACAVAVRGLRLLGARHVSYLVPDRVVDGYGLTPAIAERVKARGAHVLITVDNGIASLDGVRAARELGLTVLITDHHLPAQIDGHVQLPHADAIVNPNQPGCAFDSKCIAGVGVVFYVLLALRAQRRARGVYESPGGASQPKLDALLPLVALGTVADVVRLDANNRRLVAQGLKRVRAGAMPAGMAALLAVAGRRFEAATTFDFGFAIGPRLNAAGRLDNMAIGIECLLTDDPATAERLAQQLDAINRERKGIEVDMREQALAVAQSRLQREGETTPGVGHAITVYDETFHEGVVGIVASRLKDRLHRPAFVFAPSAAEGQGHLLKGSGRSIAGFHLRDALDLLAKRHPGVLLRFGGHAMAAGCTLHADRIGTFEAALAEIAHEWLTPAQLARQIETDGSLPAEYRRVEMVDTLHREVWGQGFAAPVFSDEVEVLSQRLVGEHHLKLQLRHHGNPVDAMWFGHTDALPARARIAYRLDADEWQGVRKLRFLIEAVQG